MCLKMSDLLSVKGHFQSIAVFLPVEGVQIQIWSPVKFCNLLSESFVILRFFTYR